MHISNVNNSSVYEQMSRSSRLKNILNRREDLWADSETDTFSSSDKDEKKSTSSDENTEPNCCLICSILPNLSNINTCDKHLHLLNTPRTTTQVVYMMHPGIDNCHCRREWKRRCRSISSSSSESRHQGKKRSMTVQSSGTSGQGELFFSPTSQSEETSVSRSDQLVEGSSEDVAQLSPSLPPSSIISTNKHYNEVLLAPFLQRTSTETDPILETSPDVVELDCDMSSIPRIPLHRIVHVKDEDEPLNDTDQKEATINMAEATEQMLIHQYPQPVILLKRIRLEE